MSTDSSETRFNRWAAPEGFGAHPDFIKDFNSYREKIGTLPWNLLMGKEVSLSELADPRHPDVFVIHRDRHLSVVDEWGDVIGFMQTRFPFSSTDFYANLTEGKGVFGELFHCNPFYRLGDIVQLGYLVPPRPDDWLEDQRIAYMVPAFGHTRWVHSLVAAILMEVILARNGFSEKERASVVLTTACHDVGMPAGGDSVKRVDPENLDEEKNFSWVMEQSGLAEKWADRFGFRLDLAQQWVRNEGMFGRLLDVVDKLSYTALDCYAIGMARPGKIRSLCTAFPLIMDVWQDICFTEDRKEFAFTNAQRLFNFLLLRAYEHDEFLFNPYSRALDLFLKRKVQPLYESGVITKEDLLTQGDSWLHNVLQEHYPWEIKAYIEPDLLGWRRVATKEEADKAQAELGVHFEHTEFIRGFNPCLDWPVFRGSEIVPLRGEISREQVRMVEEIVEGTKGYYVYYVRG